MKNLTQFISERTEGEVLLVISLNNSDGVHNAYYFFTSLPEEDTKIINTKLVPDRLREVLEKKAPKVMKEIDETIEDAWHSGSKAYARTERIKLNKIKKI
jgi:hypothetical protein